MIQYCTLSLKHTGPTVGRLKHLGRLRRVREQFCTVCSAALEAFGTVWTAPATIQLAKSENIGCWPSEPLDTPDWLCASWMTILIGGGLTNQHGVCEGRNSACTAELNGVRFVFLCTPLCHFAFSCFGVLAQDDVKETYCISRKPRTYMLLWSWQLLRWFVSLQLFCRTGQMRGKWSGRIKAVGHWFEPGRCAGVFGLNWMQLSDIFQGLSSCSSGLHLDWI